MFEPELWRMVRTLERERRDQGVDWRMRLADERRAARRSLHFGPRRRLEAAAGARTVVAFGRALPGRGG